MTLNGDKMRRVVWRARRQVTEVAGDRLSHFVASWRANEVTLLCIMLIIMVEDSLGKRASITSGSARATIFQDQKP